MSGSGKVPLRGETPYIEPMNTQPAPVQTPDAVSAIAAARALAPVLRERAVETDALRRLPDENVADMKEAGLFRVIQPARCGGWQMDFHAHLDVVEEVAAGCGASGWCLGVLQIHSWVAGLMSEQAQDDIYADNPDALIVAVLNPRGEAKPTGDGYVVSGFWPFGSGSEHSDWAILGARVLDADGNGVDEGCFLIPTSEIEIKDDWRVAGLRGTGSCSLVAKDVTVPAHRYISFVDGRAGKTPGGHLHKGTLYKAPLAPPLAIALCGPGGRHRRGRDPRFHRLCAGAHQSASSRRGADRIAAHPSVGGGSQGPGGCGPDAAAPRGGRYP